VIRVSLISVTPVKCFALSHPDSIELTEGGIVENRRFFLVDGEGKRLRSSLTSWPMVLRADYDIAAERLRISFPDGAVTEDSALGNGEVVDVDYHDSLVPCRVLDGHWTERLSRLAGHPVRLVRPEQHGHVQEADSVVVAEGGVPQTLGILLRQLGEVEIVRRILPGCREVDLLAVHDSDSRVRETRSASTNRSAPSRAAISSAPRVAARMVMGSAVRPKWYRPSWGHGPGRVSCW